MDINISLEFVKKRFFLFNINKSGVKGFSTQKPSSTHKKKLTKGVSLIFFLYVLSPLIEIKLNKNFILEKFYYFQLISLFIQINSNYF